MDDDIMFMVIGVCVVFLMLILSIGWSYDSGQNRLMAQCDNFGLFLHGDKRYSCSLDAGKVSGGDHE